MITLITTVISTSEFHTIVNVMRQIYAHSISPHIFHNFVGAKVGDGVIADLGDGVGAFVSIGDEVGLGVGSSEFSGDEVGFGVGPSVSTGDCVGDTGADVGSS